MSVALHSNRGRRDIVVGFIVLALTIARLTADEYQRASVDELWALQPFAAVHESLASSGENPIDRLLHAEQRRAGLKALPAADKLTLLRRLKLDLLGLPPTIKEQDAFLADASESAYERLVDRFLDDEQHGVRYGRHWLDVLRYADVDERMPAGSSLYLWRDWVIRALNRNLPYDAFVRTQISGIEVAERTTINALGYRSRRTPRPENVFALGFLARGATSRANNDHALSMAAVETVSTAFLGMTVQCSKCHDHFFDPISQEDYYRMKAVFDPLVLRNLQLATAAEIVEHGEAVREYEAEKIKADGAVVEIEGPYRTKLYEERVGMLPADIQTIIRKPETLRTPEEQKIADDYFPVLRIDVGKIREVMPSDVLEEYDRLRKAQGAIRRPPSLPSFLTVEEDSKRREEVRYVLNSGDANRPEMDRPVKPGLLFESGDPEFREGLRETLVDWMTAKENSLFARVAVNRIWQWHFGSGLHEQASDFGSLVSRPKLQSVLDTLAAEFVEHGYDMKWLHKRIVLSETYRRASSPLGDVGHNNESIDRANDLYWRFPLRRLEAEPIYDALLSLAERLDLGIGGKSYLAEESLETHRRRGIYLKRGFRSQEDQLPEFLDAFDAEDGRESCSRREETVTAPQALWLMNNPLVDAVAQQFGERLETDSSGDPLVAVELGYRSALGRHPTPQEIRLALEYLDEQPEKFERLAWLLINLDEFLYVR